MKRLSNKKRKLKYIRFKNNIRNFKPVYHAVKLSSSKELTKEFLVSESESFIKQILHDYKIQTKLKTISTGVVYFDNIDNTITFKLGFSKIKHGI